MHTNAGESPDRRERRRAVMSPFQLILMLAVLALPFTVERTMVYLKGHSKWDTAFETLVDAFKSLHEYLDKQNIKPTGPAFTVYTQTDDTGFSYQAALPVAESPKDPPKGDIAVGPAPSGKAYKFVHRGSYDAMDTTYEAITNYLDDKQLEAKDLFIEEYTTDPVKSDPDKLVVNVFVPVK